jgi:hypothetical protein
LATILGQASEAHRAAEREKADAFIRQILSGDVDDGSGSYKLRAIVEHDFWYVPIKENGRFELLNIEKGQCERLICAVSKRDGRRTERTGKGGQFVPAYSGKPAHKNIRVDGRTLARSLPVNATGLLIHDHDEQRDQNGQEFRRCELSSEFFPRMQSLADAVEIEDVLLAAEPIDATRLREYKLLVDMADDEHLHMSPSIIEGEVACFVDIDEGGFDDCGGVTVFDADIHERCFHMHLAVPELTRSIDLHQIVHKSLKVVEQDSC